MVVIDGEQQVTYLSEEADSELLALQLQRGESAAALPFFNKLLPSRPFLLYPLDCCGSIPHPLLHIHLPPVSMKRLIPFALSLFSAGSALSVEPEVPPYTIPHSGDFTMRSQAGEDYRITLSWPEGKAPEAGWPVIYLLDGDDNFLVLTSVLRRLTATPKAAKQNAISPGIIVGIGYTGESKRDFDYTPQAEASGPPETYLDGKPYPPREYGGADAFFRFLQDELKPRIAKTLPVDTSRQTLYGTGFGGLFTLHTLFTQPDSFQTYIACSPSIWWNNRWILSQEKAFTEKHTGKPIPARLYIATGEFEQSLTPTEFAWPDKEREEHALKIGRRRMVDNTREMFWRLRDSGLLADLQYRIFSGEGHSSVAPMAAGPAVQFAFPPSGK